MTVVLYRPSSEKISSTTPEQVGFDFKPTDCLRLIRNLQYMYLTNKGKCEDGFVELCSTVLQGIVHDYRKYMEWMLQENIISVNNHYVVGEKCRSYRLNYPFDPELVDDVQQFFADHDIPQATLTLQQTLEMQRVNAALRARTVASW